jgi:hypothetical protein
VLLLHTRHSRLYYFVAEGITSEINRRRNVFIFPYIRAALAFELAAKHLRRHFRSPIVSVTLLNYIYGISN